MPDTEAAFQFLVPESFWCLPS